MSPEKSNLLSNELKINQEWCKGCGVCVAFCRKEALFLNENGKVDRHADKCITCGVCETFCPDFAIVLIKRGKFTDAGDKTGFDARQ